MIADRACLELAVVDEKAHRIMKGHPGTCDGGGTGAAIGLQHIAIERDLAFTKGRQIDHGAQGAADEALDFLGAAGDLAGGGFAAHALARGARQHAIFSRHPALALAFQPWWQALFDGGRAQHMGVAEFHKAGTFGVLGDGTLKADGSELGKFAAGWAHGAGSFKLIWPAF